MRTNLSTANNPLSIILRIFIYQRYASEFIINNTTYLCLATVVSKLIHYMLYYLMQILLELEKKLEYTFKNPELLKQALTHTSYGGESFQLLEFLGDRVLNLSLTLLLSQQQHMKTEGHMAQAIAALGSKETLLEIAHVWQLEKFVQCHHRQVHGILPDACEAILGAIFRDSEENIQLLQTLVWRFWKDKIQSSDYKDPKSALQEWAYKVYKITPKYNTYSTGGAAHEPTFHSIVQIEQYIGEGTGTTIKDAEKIAARNLLKSI